jgi:hypothetical protein
MIKFEQGSGRYDSGAEVFAFRGTLGDRPVPCAISREAFEDMLVDATTEERMLRLFPEWEHVVFALAEEKYRRSGLNDRGAITLSVDDVAAFNRI